MFQWEQRGLVSKYDQIKESEIGGVCTMHGREIAWHSDEVAIEKWQSWLSESSFKHMKELREPHLFLPQGMYTSHYQWYCAYYSVMRCKQSWYQGLL
jgi:hypothetical protein